MDALVEQLNIERRYSKRLVKEQLKDILPVLIDFDEIHARWDLWLSIDTSGLQDVRKRLLVESLKKRDMTIIDLMLDVLIELHIAGKEVILQSLCGSLARVCNTGDAFQDAQSFAEVIMLMNGLIYTTEPRGSYVLIKTKHKLVASIETLITDTGFVPPMIIEPVKYTNKIDGGYLKHPNRLFTKKSKRKKVAVNLDFINRINSTPMAIDMNMVHQVRKPKKPLTNQAQVNSFNTLRTATIKTSLLLIELGNWFHLLYQYDDRGRTYAQGSEINPMGDDYSKALLNLAIKEYIDESY